MWSIVGKSPLCCSSGRITPPPNYWKDYTPSQPLLLRRITPTIDKGDHTNHLMGFMVAEPLLRYHTCATLQQYPVRDKDQDTEGGPVVGRGPLPHACYPLRDSCKHALVHGLQHRFLDAIHGGDARSSMHLVHGPMVAEPLLRYHTCATLQQYPVRDKDQDTEGVPVVGRSPLPHACYPL